MSGRVRRFLYVLLFALICSLGDGPFLDELEAMADGQQQVQLAVQHDRATSDQPAAMMIVYATLMSAADISAFPSIGTGSGTQVLPGYLALAYSGPALARPAKPPRSSLA